MIEAENGAVGIEKARKELPDLILCDVNMEKVDGYLTLSVAPQRAGHRGDSLHPDDRPGGQRRDAARHGTGRG